MTEEEIAGQTRFTDNSIHEEAISEISTLRWAVNATILFLFQLVGIVIFDSLLFNFLQYLAFRVFLVFILVLLAIYFGGLMEYGKHRIRLEEGGNNAG
jgi:hypothetical protein